MFQSLNEHTPSAKQLTHTRTHNLILSLCPIVETCCWRDKEWRSRHRYKLRHPLHSLFFSWKTISKKKDEQKCSELMTTSLRCCLDWKMEHLNLATCLQCWATPVWSKGHFAQRVPQETRAWQRIRPKTRRLQSQSKPQALLQSQKDPSDA